MTTRIALLTAALAFAAGCSKKVFSEPVTLFNKLDKDGNEIPNSAEVLQPEKLNRGYEAYMLYCYGCHGEHGDGMGPASPTMRPPPRNFARGLFKFPGTAFGQLPVDTALDRTIRRGLHGTPMLPWDIPKMEREALIAYIKTLSPRWKEEGVPPEIEIAPDPWKGKKEEAIVLGRQVYHVAQDGAGCNGCHASYEPRAVISEMTQKITGEPVTEFAEEMYRTSLKDSEYPTMWHFGDRRIGCSVTLSEVPADPDALAVQVNGRPVDRDAEHKEGWDIVKPEAPAAGHGEKHGHHAAPKPKLTFFGKVCEEIQKSEAAPSIALTRAHRILPPDFLFHKVKTAYPVGTLINEGDHNYVTYTEEMQREDLYRTIGVGIGGAAMPGWKGVLSEDKLWALVYYVQSLIQKNDTQAAFELRTALDSQPAWVPPAPAAPEVDAGTP